jgi:hypothetical protein
MKLMVIMVSLLLLAIAAVCLLGFLATFEPTAKTTQNMAFKIGYSVIGLSCIVGAVFLIVNVVSKRDEPLP